MPKTKQTTARGTKNTSTVTKKKPEVNEDEREIVLPPALEEKVEEVEVALAEGSPEELEVPEDEAEEEGLDGFGDTGWDE